MRWKTILESAGLDVKYSLRTLARNRTFTAIACLSLAIGIGATTAAFSVWDALLLRPLPVRDPDRLVLITTRNAGSLRALSHPSFTYLRDHSSTLEGLAAFRPATVNVSAGARTERVVGMLVSGSYFAMLGPPMALGSPILADDDRIPRAGGGRGLVAVISHDFWRERLSANPAVVGSAIRVNGNPVTIVGVTSSGFTGTATGSVPGVYLPMMFAPHIFDGPWLENPRNLWLRMIGRLKHGTSPEQAEAELTLALRQFYQDVVVPVADTDLTRRRAREAAIVLEPGAAGLLELGDTVRPTVFALLGLVGLVMVMACINVAGLMIARAERLHKDTATCLALGASRARLWSRTLAESFAIGITGIGLGVLLSAWLRGALGQLVTVSGTLDLRMDGRVLLAAVLAGLAATVFIGGVTAWSQTRLEIIRTLKGEDLPARLLLRKALIVGQLAVSVVVLVASALFVHTLSSLRQIDVGFARDRITVASTAPAGYSPERRRAFYARLLDDVRSVPGVASAALAGNEPMGVNTGWNIRVRRGPGREPEAATASVMSVSPGYFSTMSIGLLQGRDFAAQDWGSASNPVIVNENFVRAYLSGTDPIGAQVVGNGNMIFEVVGVVRDTATFSLRDLDQHMIYVPAADGVLHVRAELAPAAVQSVIEQAVRRIDADVPVFNVRSVEQVLDRFLTRERTLAWLSSTFGLLALGLVAVGLYGVMSNTVSRRTRELGIRVALGADAGRVTRLILREAIVLVAIGTLAGIPLVVAIGRLLESLLFGVQPLDWKSIAAAVAILTTVAAFAAWVPARRAGHIDPLAALKAE